MIIVPLFDIALLILNVVLAVMNRGTFWGWFSAVIVVWQVWVLVNFIRSG